MGLWKILFGVLIGVALTESGRNTIKNLGKQMMDNSEDFAEKGRSLVMDTQHKASECISEVQTKAKELIDTAQAKAKEMAEVNQTKQSEDKKNS